MSVTERLWPTDKRGMVLAEGGGRRNATSLLQQRRRSLEGSVHGGLLSAAQRRSRGSRHSAYLLSSDCWLNHPSTTCREYHNTLQHPSNNYIHLIDLQPILHSLHNNITAVDNNTTATALITTLQQSIRVQGFRHSYSNYSALVSLTSQPMRHSSKPNHRSTPPLEMLRFPSYCNSTLPVSPALLVPPSSPPTSPSSPTPPSVSTPPLTQPPLTSPTTPPAALRPVSRGESTDSQPMIRRRTSYSQLLW